MPEPLEPVELLTAEQRAAITVKLGDGDPLPLEQSYAVMMAPLMHADPPFFRRVLALEAEVARARAEAKRLAGHRPWTDRISRREYLERRARCTVSGARPVPEPLDLDALAALEAAATPAPWHRAKDHPAARDDHYENAVGNWSGEYARAVTGGTGIGAQADADAQLIVAARNALPGLLGELARARADAEHPMYRAAYWDGLEVLDRYLGGKESDGAGALGVAQRERDDARAKLERVTAERDDALTALADLGYAAHTEVEP